MRSYSTILLSLFLTTACQQKSKLPQLEEPVEVIRDENGINHIFAENEHDLFFAQGYLAAKDRIFQFEIWRRQATGTLSEILGPKALDRDIGARLFQYRGEKEKELSHYHSRGVEIVDAFVAGINAYVEEVRSDPSLLPIEFDMLGIIPGFWTWEVVISRHQGLLQNVEEELMISRIVQLIGPEATKELFYFHPFTPDLDLHSSIPKELLFKDIIAPYEAFRAYLKFDPEDVSPTYRNTQEAFLHQSREEEMEHAIRSTIDYTSIGSNNWVVSGELSESGYPMMANDPHRRHSAPSLRYWAGLHAPGWDLVGGGEPVLPGLSIGQNGVGAWGLTIFRTDMEDLRIYDMDPESLTRYKYQGEWKEMQTIQDTILVRGEEPEVVTHYYTLHGPVTFIDEELHKAVAIECAWLETGGAPYLASLRMDQAQSWEEFREACKYNHVPAENMVWADKEGNIGWQATGIAPIRKTHSGMVVVPGDGSFDWEGYLPMLERPNVSNPSKGYYNTSNENQVDTDYSHPETIGYTWSDSFRGDRVKEILGSGEKFTIKEMAALQNDYLSIPARILVQEIESLTFKDEQAENARKRLLDWDYRLMPNSIPAGIYVMWERKIREGLFPMVVPQEARQWMESLNMTKILNWIKEKDATVFKEKDRDTFLEERMVAALEELEGKLGPDWENWQYGQAAYKHALIRHPLSAAVSPEWQEKIDVGPAPRGGYSYTPGANAYGNNNTTGGSFKIVVDTGDFEATLGINTPGQTGDPESRFYRNLFGKWANDEYFNVNFTKERLREKAVENYTLK
ncbi:penicillin acylase family protein [Pleomorphovibrio marinus]|uniref:penicillin acylase family protein n=1 Tax=Pleomorphovibrio marinus TaxID=2164132 RepID=UPI000E0BD1FA|nr:penicillin acylase family protein [Pleomorphovibrio marinus]